MERKIGTATSAVERFIRTVHKDDDIFLMTFNNRPDLAQDFTDDRDRLARALRRVTVGGGTALYDALDLSLRKVKHGTQDKKAILLLIYGEDTTSETSLEDAQAAVRESELLVYCLGISPSGAPLTERNPYPVPGGPTGGPTGPGGSGRTGGVRASAAARPRSGASALPIDGAPARAAEHGQGREGKRDPGGTQLHDGGCSEVPRHIKENALMRGSRSVAPPRARLARIRQPPTQQDPEPAGQHIPVLRQQSCSNPHLTVAHRSQTCGLPG